MAELRREISTQSREVSTLDSTTFAAVDCASPLDKSFSSFTSEGTGTSEESSSSASTSVSSSARDASALLQLSPVPVDLCED